MNYIYPAWYEKNHLDPLHFSEKFIDIQAAFCLQEPAPHFGGTSVWDILCWSRIWLLSDLPYDMLVVSDVRVHWGPFVNE